MPCRDIFSEPSALLLLVTESDIIVGDIMAEKSGAFLLLVTESALVSSVWNQELL